MFTDWGAGHRNIHEIYFGRSAAYTGERTDTWHGHLLGPNYAIVGNRLVGAETLNAMKVSFESNDTAPLGKRLLLALSAGEAAGGDKLGRQSAALKVHGRQEYSILDLRVDEHPEPVTELLRIYGVAENILIPLISSLPTAEAGNFTFKRSAVDKDGVVSLY